MLGAGHTGKPVKRVGKCGQIGLVQGADAVKIERGIHSFVCLGPSAGKVLVAMGQVHGEEAEGGVDHRYAARQGHGEKAVVTSGAPDGYRRQLAPQAALEGEEIATADAVGYQPTGLQVLAQLALPVRACGIPGSGRRQVQPFADAEILCEWQGAEHICKIRHEHDIGIDEHLCVVARLLRGVVGQPVKARRTAGGSSNRSFGFFRLTQWILSGIAANRKSFTIASMNGLPFHTLIQH